MARVFKTALAERDLEAIWLHIATDNPAAADRWLDALMEKALILAEQPHLGRARPDLLPNLAPDLRSFPIKTYILFYRPIAGGIEIVRALHSARDVNDALSERS